MRSACCLTARQTTSSRTIKWPPGCAPGATSLPLSQWCNTVGFGSVRVWPQFTMNTLAVASVFLANA